MCLFIDMLELVQRSQVPKPSDHTELALPLLLLFRASTATAAQNEISQLILWALFKAAPVAALLPPALPWAKCFYCTNTQRSKEFQRSSSSLFFSPAPVANSAPTWQHRVTVRVWVSFPSQSWAQGEISSNIDLLSYIYKKDTASCPSYFSFFLSNTIITFFHGL